MYLEIRAEACTGCRICQQFCSFRHEHAIWLDHARITIIACSDDGPFAPNVCRQCPDGPCAAACPVGAIQRDPHNIAWLVDPEECIGCSTCVGACPYAGIRLDTEQKLAIKCDLCNGEPVCATMCPSGAIVQMVAGH